MHFWWRLKKTVPKNRARSDDVWCFRLGHVDLGMKNLQFVWKNRQFWKMVEEWIRRPMIWTRYFCTRHTFSAEFLQYEFMLRLQYTKFRRALMLISKQRNEDSLDSFDTGFFWKKDKWFLSILKGFTVKICLLVRVHKRIHFFSGRKSTWPICR